MRGAWTIATLLLLLASFSEAQVTRAAEPGPGWTSVGNGCAVWNPDASADVSGSWTGGCKNGRAEGKGILTWQSGGKQVGVFEGNMHDGKKNGHGTEIFADRGRYEGEWRDSDGEGRGVYVYPDGDRYDGDWHRSEKHGHGVFTWADGSRYDGDWRNDHENGLGVLTLANGDRYEGQFIDGMASGHGVMKFANGNWYEGEWQSEKPNGRGRALVAGNTYEGVWKDGCFRDGKKHAALLVPDTACQ